MAQTSSSYLNLTGLDEIARQHGWTVERAEFPAYVRVFRRGGAVIMFENAHSSAVTNVKINEGSGVIYTPKTNKRAEIVAALQAPRKA